MVIVMMRRSTPSKLPLTMKSCPWIECWNSWLRSASAAPELIVVLRRSAGQLYSTVQSVRWATLVDACSGKPGKRIAKMFSWHVSCVAVSLISQYKWVPQWLFCLCRCFHKTLDILYVWYEVFSTQSSYYCHWLERRQRGTGRWWEIGRPLHNSTNKTCRSRPILQTVV